MQYSATGANYQAQFQERKVTVIRDTQLRSVKDHPEGEENWNALAELSNGTTIGCDLIIEATGVVPNSSVPWRRDSDEVSF